MPSRVLREAILDSEAVNALSVPAELFYRRLMSVVDDFGRFDARPSVLRSRCYPLRVASVREADITRWLAECETAGLIVLYSSGSSEYLLFRKLGAPRAKTSKFPAPPAGIDDSTHPYADARTCAQMNTDARSRIQTRADVPGSSSGSSPGSNSSSGTPPTPPRGEGAPGFDVFWEAYPRKQAKDRALRAWKKLEPSQELQQTILGDVEIRSHSEQWTKESGQFIPHASTYLAGRRWEDELPTRTADPVRQKIIETGNLFINRGKENDQT